MGRTSKGYKLKYSGEETDDALDLARNVKFVPTDAEHEEYANAIAACVASYLCNMVSGTTTCVNGSPTQTTPFVAVYLDRYGTLYMDLMKYKTLVSGETTFCHYDSNDLTAEEQAATEPWHPTYNGRYDTMTISGTSYPILYMNCSGFVSMLTKNRDYPSGPYYLRYTNADATPMMMASRCVEKGDTATSPWTFDCLNLMLTWRMAECMRSSGCTPFKVGEMTSAASFDEVGLGKLRDGDLIFVGNPTNQQFAARYKGIHHCLVYFSDLSRLNAAASNYGTGVSLKAMTGDAGDTGKGYVVHCTIGTDTVPLSVRGHIDCLRLETLDHYLANCASGETLWGCRVASNALNSAKMLQNITSDLMLYDCIVTNPWRHNVEDDYGLNRIPVTNIRAFVEGLDVGTYGYNQTRYNQPMAVAGDGDTLDFNDYIGAPKSGVYCLWDTNVTLVHGPTSASDVNGTTLTTPTNVSMIFEVMCVNKLAGYTVQTLTTLYPTAPLKWERVCNSEGTWGKWQQIAFGSGSGGGSSGVSSVNNRTGAVVLDKTDVGLGNVDNTSDANKPISTATQTALNGKISAPASPSSGQFLVYNGSAWVAMSLSTWQGGSY